MTEYTLSQPPTTNELYSGRRYKTARYKSWINSAGWELLTQRPPKIAGNFALIVWTPGRGDIDNLKALPDLLQKLHLIENDSKMVELHVYRDPGQFRFKLEQR